jgi:predicted phage tail protein
MEVYIELLRPVNPVGRSFITNVYGAISAKDKDLIDKYKKEIMRSIQRLGFKLEEIIGRGKLISGTIAIVIDDTTKEPKKVYTKDIKIWSAEKSLDKNIEIEIS